MNHNTLSNAMPIVAAAYGRKFGVAIQVGGDTAGTDGTTIHIPAISEEPRAKSLAWGYLAHEAGHVRHTDFAAWHSVCHQPLTQAITNILEDVRIENAMIKRYPGTRQTLDAVLDWMIAEGKIAAPATNQRPAAVFANAILVLARYRYRQQEALQSLAQSSEHMLRRTFPQSFVHRLLGLMAEIAPMQNTTDAADLAQRMVALTQEEAAQQSRKSNSESGTGESPQPEPGSAGRDCDPDRTSGDDSTNESGSKDQGDGSSDAGSESLEPCTDTSGLESVLSAGAEDLPEDVFETVAEALGTQSQSRGVTLLPALQDYAGNKLQGSALLAQAKGHSAKLTTRLQGLVQAHTLTRARTVRHGRSLSASRLHRVAVGDGRVFSRKDRKTAPNTAIHLLVDLSGSMAGGKNGVALEAAMALALALEPIQGVSRAVTAFPGLAGQDDEVTRILEHGDRTSTRAGAFIQHARGSTPMTGALWFAAADLVPRQEERKVVLTLTDGSPDDWDSAADVIAKAGSAGIEMIGVGIQHDVSRLFPVAIRIDDISDLKTELFSIAERLFLS